MDIAFLRRTKLFEGMSEKEILDAAQSMRMTEKRYKKGSRILCAGETATQFGLIVQGSATIESNDIWGNRTILARVGKGQLFAESYALCPDTPLMVDVVTNETCSVCFFTTTDFDALKKNGKPWTLKFTTNLLAVSVRKNLELSLKTFLTSPKTIRERVLAYLNAVALRNHATEFDIPFDRQQLADYLNLDRSALSKELGKMRDDGIIEFRKNRFALKGKHRVK